MSSLLDEVPAGMRPDRAEVVGAITDSPEVEIERGVLFRALVGQHNHARNLTTGIVTFAPAAALPYHTHPFAESVTLVLGEAILEVEGRCYRLRSLDNITIPSHTPHAARNTSLAIPAVFHIAMATDQPTRTLVTASFPRILVDDRVSGLQVKERINRQDLTPATSWRREPTFRIGSIGTSAARR